MELRKHALFTLPCAKTLKINCFLARSVRMNIEKDSFFRPVCRDLGKSIFLELALYASKDEGRQASAFTNIAVVDFM